MSHRKKRADHEEFLALLKKTKKSSTLTLEEIIETLLGKGRSLVLIFLSLPFCQPIPIPGLSTLFGVVVAFLGLRMAFGKGSLLPQSMLSKKIPSKPTRKIIEKSRQLIDKLRPFIRPRLQVLCEHGVMQIVSGLLVFILGFLLALPLPIPFTNLAVGWPLFFLSLGQLENDGLLVLLGYLLSLGALAFFLTLAFSLKHFI